MAKGFFTQTVVILFQQVIEVNSLKPLLSDFNIVKEVSGSKEWAFSGPSLIIEFREDVNGFISIDVVGQQWPDHMGDPKTDAMIFGAWSMGHFGPYTYPNGLSRSIQQSWRWDAAKNAVEQHSCFVRLRLSYTFGADDNSPVMPKDCDPREELSFITSIAEALLQHNDAICYFNPNGEVLLTKDMLSDTIKYHKEQDIPPLDAWSNIRMFNLSEGWTLMDTVGSWQLDIPDQEVAFPKESFNPQDVDYFIRNATLYILTNGMVI